MGGSCTAHAIGFIDQRIRLHLPARIPNDGHSLRAIPRLYAAIARRYRSTRWAWADIRLLRCATGEVSAIRGHGRTHGRGAVWEYLRVRGLYSSTSTITDSFKCLATTYRARQLRWDETPQRSSYRHRIPQQAIPRRRASSIAAGTLYAYQTRRHAGWPRRGDPNRGTPNRGR